jgi:cytochrome oxidase Cu insertion factor (SCO1/SenC/PrrC family)
MSGMGSSLQAGNSTMVAAFRAALIHQGIIIAVIFALLLAAWISFHEWLPSARTGNSGAGDSAGLAEPAGRRLLRIGFGVLWIFDGVLQMQSAMPVGLPSQVMVPSSASSPGWVKEAVGWAANAWTYHPVTAAASAVWIQIGIGIWLVAAGSGTWSRLGGLASLGWGLIVWVFGEAFGGIFGPGLTWLFGAPGAALFYSAAGGLIALPLRAWVTPRLGRLVLAVVGLFFSGMAVLQAWPGRGFWQGTAHGQPGTLTAMIQGMSKTSQPHVLAALVANFGSFTAAHGFAVNLFAVITLAATGAALLSGQPRLLRPAIAVVTIICLADWLLIEDLGFFGGLGTDPNSMIPMTLVVIAGYLALTRVPVAVAVPAHEPAQEPAREPAQERAQKPAQEPAQKLAQKPANEPAPGSAQKPVWRDSVRPSALRRAIGAASLGSVAAVGALAMTAIGAIPMASASANRQADPIIAEAIAGSSAAFNYPAPAFQLTDQQGARVTLASLRGKAVLLTFLDPVCTTDCPLIAQEFRAAGELLGANSKRVELVAVVANPIYRSAAFTRAFDRQERMDKVPNWLYLTGTLPQLTNVWRAYDIAVQTEPAGAMIAHNDIAFVIDGAGRIRQELNSDPGPGTASSKSSFAAVLAQAAENVLRLS